MSQVKDAGCHLFDGSSGRDLARFQMTNMAFLDKHTALLVGNLFRDVASGGAIIDGEKPRESDETASMAMQSGMRCETRSATTGPLHLRRFSTKK